MGKSGAQDREILVKAGLRVTRARLDLLRVLREQHGPFTLDELHRRVRESRCDAATVYRVLTAFEDAELVHRCEFGDGVSRFELRHDGHHHHHVICKSCGKVKSLDYCVVEGIEQLLHREGFRDISHSLEFFATCERCARDRH